MSYFCPRTIPTQTAPLTLLFMAIGSIASANPAYGQEPIAHGLHDLVVYDPGAHERGLPSPELLPSGDGLVVDIPPTVHIHRYYYSGDKEIQGPILSGGPTVVVANHPKTGERMYIDVVLPAGAPRIAYSKHCITYVYPNTRVSVGFQHFPKDPNKAVVTVRGGQGFGRTVKDAHEHVHEHVKDGMANSAFVQSTKQAAGEVCDFFVGMKVAVGELGAKSVGGMKRLTNLVPGVTYAKSLAEQEPERDYANSIRAADTKKARTETTFVPTNR